jgi:hypothetical protein
LHKVNFGLVPECFFCLPKYMQISNDSVLSRSRKSTVPLKTYLNNSQNNYIILTIIFLNERIVAGTQYYGSLDYSAWAPTISSYGALWTLPHIPNSNEALNFRVKVSYIKWTGIEILGQSGILSCYETNTCRELANRNLRMYTYWYMSELPPKWNKDIFL